MGGGGSSLDFPILQQVKQDADVTQGADSRHAKATQAMCSESISIFLMI